MEAAVEKAMRFPFVAGVLVLSPDWLVIISRGALSAQDGPELERKLAWTDMDSTGSIPWGSDGARVHFHKAKTHVLIFLKDWKSSCVGATKAMACSSSSLRAESKSWLSAPSSSFEAIKAARPRSWY
ncbi:hypothetical protein SCHPADRAFT_148065 [Schizopora paradoxa]|uniref:Uncharacterized protein n=1 Tax=Schizopora paradoxa TaxID=27342 RepID=A0A0H2SKX6_9AGAM|nr:hypothetical protein SCHPADRAFT_148065 [Schizopora paradoxa]